MQEKKTPGQGGSDLGGGKQWPEGGETGKQGGGGQGDVGKKGGSGEIGREGDKTGTHTGGTTEKR